MLTKLAAFLAYSNGPETMARQAPLTGFVAEWDATHSVTVGEKLTRGRTMPRILAFVDTNVRD